MPPGRLGEPRLGPIALRFRLRLIVRTGLALAAGVAVPLGVFWLLTADLRATDCAEAMRSFGQAMGTDCAVGPTTDRRTAGSGSRRGDGDHRGKRQGLPAAARLRHRAHLRMLLACC